MGGTIHTDLEVTAVTRRAEGLVLATSRGDLINAPSPAAKASLAIGAELGSQAIERFGL